MSFIALLYILVAEGTIGLAFIAMPLLVIIAIIALFALAAGGSPNTSHR